jgi:hypothetical protein
VKELIDWDKLIERWLRDLYDGFKRDTWREAQSWTIAYGLNITIHCYDNNKLIFNYGSTGQSVNLEYTDLKQDTSLISLVKSKLDKNVTEDYMICEIFQAFKSNKEDIFEILQNYLDENIPE